MSEAGEFQIHRVNIEDADDVETLGTKEKFWWFNQAQKRLLFKAEDRGTGEDWAEKIASHLCELLGMSHVHYEMAEEFSGGNRTRPGVICENLAPSPLSLVLGNQLLFERDDSYPIDEKAKYKVRMHTVSAIVNVLNSLKPPQGWHATLNIQSALDVFVGYIMLDAWIANQDRHHGNWGAIRDVNGELFLSPTFDHGAALARLLTDAERNDRLNTRDRNRSIETYAGRARSACYPDTNADKTLGTLECLRAFADRSPRAAQEWAQRLNSVEEMAVRQIIFRVPVRRMSDISKRFTLELLNENKKRILQT